MAGPKRKPLVAGNWKMNGLKSDLRELKKMLAGAGKGAGFGCDFLICPPATLIAPFAEAAKGGLVRIGAQDCHPKPAGAHTGDVSAPQLRDAGARFVIVGHSERRQDHNETSALVQKKALAALEAGLSVIICVGETLAERERGITGQIVEGQIRESVPKSACAKQVVIAYEPVWAIGTGKTPTPDEVAAVHGQIRDLLARHLGTEGAGMRILYGGSVKPDNAATLLTVGDVDGALVGGASLKATDFLAIANVYARKPTLAKNRRSAVA
jgi:triosephosphate isomerase